MTQIDKKIIGIVPCRYGAVRFPGKPLVDINGKPMMWHVYQQAQKCSLLSEIYIATDDERIRNSATDLGLNVIMTRQDHVSGSDRIAECAEKIDADIYVNIQGDEPMIEPGAIAAVADGLARCENLSIVVSNAYTNIEHASDVVDTNNVKVILTQSSLAMAYSRQPIPYPKNSEVHYLRQLGLYAFSKKALKIFSSLAPGPVELAEGVEMLRFLEHGHPVLMVKVVDNSIPVDTPSDLERVRTQMRV
jgi:3-deoxy-manno-octulosonate cytidylyltransferase (CMP-KDO synthetase)